MTVPVGDPLRGRADSDVAVARNVCPYLASDDGAWLSADPSRDHRCTAVSPSTPPAADKQRRFCLAAAHVECATYMAARELHGPTPATEPVAPWHFSRPVPVLLDHGHSPSAYVGRARRWGLGQVGLVALMVVAFATVVLARGLAPSGPNSALADVSPSPSASPSPRPSPSPPPSPSPSPSPLPSPSPSPAAAGETYRVKAGDTLGAIAERFGTTVKAIMQANGITDAKLIKVGQRLTIPK